MSESARPTREERLAAQLRVNLRRRKVQGRALAAGAPAPDADMPDDMPDDSGQHLPKSTPPR